MALAIDGCSVPTWSLPLARSGARLRAVWDRARASRPSAARPRSGCAAPVSPLPALVAGEGRFDTIAMRALAPAVFVKGGAEGVHCAALPELGLGIALKVDDGAKRGTERALAEVLAVLLPEARNALAEQLEGELLNWRGLRVGRVVASAALLRGLAAMDGRAAPEGRGRLKVGMRSAGRGLAGDVGIDRDVAEGLGARRARGRGRSGSVRSWRGSRPPSRR